MKDKRELICNMLNEIEANRKIEAETVAKSIVEKIRELGFEAEEDEQQAEEALTDMGFSADDFEYELYDDDFVRECKNHEEYRHPWDWYRFSVNSVSCGDTEIFYVDYEGD